MPSILRGAAAIALSLLAAGAAIADPVVVTAAPRPTLATPVSRAAMPAYHQTPAYTTFDSSPGQLYYCCAGYSIAGAGVTGDTVRAVAVPFTPMADMHLRNVRLAIGWFGGTNAVKVSLHENDGGLPGRPVGEVDVAGLPAMGQCCETRSAKAGGPRLHAWTTYWVAVRPAAGDTDAVWNMNSIGRSGSFAFDDGSGWQFSYGTLPAIAVFPR